MADKIGVARKWWQSPEKTSESHYDICLSKKALAIQYSAIEITWRQAGAMNSRRRVTGQLGKPEDTEEWLKAYMEERRKLKESKGDGRKNYLPFLFYIFTLFLDSRFIFNSLSRI